MTSQPVAAHDHAEIVDKRISLPEALQLLASAAGLSVYFLLLGGIVY